MMRRGGKLPQWGAIGGHLVLHSVLSHICVDVCLGLLSSHHSRITQGSLKDHSRITRGSLGDHSGITQGSLKDHSRITRGQPTASRTYTRTHTHAHTHTRTRAPTRTHDAHPDAHAHTHARAHVPSITKGSPTPLGGSSDSFCGPAQRLVTPSAASGDHIKGHIRNIHSFFSLANDHINKGFEAYMAF